MCVVFVCVYRLVSVRLMCILLYNSQFCYNFVYLYASIIIYSTKKDTFESKLPLSLLLSISFVCPSFTKTHFRHTLHKGTDTNTTETVAKSSTLIAASDSGGNSINEEVSQHKPRWVSDSILTE